MADPFHGNRHKKQEAVQSAYQKAMSIPRQRPVDQAPSVDHPWDAKKVYLHPVYKYPMNEWEYNLFKQEEKDKEAERTAERTASATEKAEGGGGVRENQQYTLALKTAFELGMNAGLMQRPPPPPCNACERRKERNRIAAQTSRVEKRKFELSLTQPQRRVRSTAGPAPPAPSYAYPAFDGIPPAPASASASTASQVEHKDEKDEEVEDEDEDEEDVEETEIHPPPF